MRNIAIRAVFRPLSCIVIDICCQLIVKNHGARFVKMYQNPVS